MLGIFPQMNFGHSDLWYAAFNLNKNLQLERNYVEDGDNFVFRVQLDAANLFFEYHILAFQNAGVLPFDYHVKEDDFSGTKKFCRYVVRRMLEGHADMPQNRDQLYEHAKRNVKCYINQEEVE